MSVITVNGVEAFECVNHPNYYVTADGCVYSIYVKGAHGKTDINRPHRLSYSEDKDGYYRVVLSDRSKKEYVKVHTLVAEQFIGAVVPPLVVNHKDGNKHNNSAENLEIVTSAYNTRHAHENGLTSRDIPVIVSVDGGEYKFHSLDACTKAFPDLKRDYLRRLKNGTVDYSMVLFKRLGSKRISPIEAIYNGARLMVFDTMQDADRYFGVARGATSSALISNQYRSRVNKYHVTFPNVSTIENALLCK